MIPPQSALSLSNDKLFKLFPSCTERKNTFGKNFDFFRIRRLCHLKIYCQHDPAPISPGSYLNKPIICRSQIWANIKTTPRHCVQRQKPKNIHITWNNQESHQSTCSKEKLWRAPCCLSAWEAVTTIQTTPGKKTCIGDDVCTDSDMRPEERMEISE